MATQFFMPVQNILGENALAEAMNVIAGMGLKKALIVTDGGLHKMGVADKIGGLLKEKNIDYAVFGKVQPNPTVTNVNDGLAALKAEGADFIVSLGGGSSHDCAKAVALVAANDGKIEDYEGLDKSKKVQLPLIAVNTTAGTASEMTRFTIITDETRYVKMAIVDKHVTPLLSVNDPALMEGMPAPLTAATGMDALTHAIEAYVSTIASPITDACAVKAIELIARHLPTAVREPNNLKKHARKWLMPNFWPAWRSTTLLWAMYTLWRTNWAASTTCRTACALLLPHVERFNQKAAKERLDEIGVVLSKNNADLAVLIGM